MYSYSSCACAPDCVSVLNFFLKAPYRRTVEKVFALQLLGPDRTRSDPWIRVEEPYRESTVESSIKFEYASDDLRVNDIAIYSPDEHSG